MYRDFKDLLSSFNVQGVKYLIVGGYAVSFHAQPRYTKDLDLFINADADNAKAAFAALRSFGAPLGTITYRDLADPNKFMRFGQEPVDVDIMPGIDGVDFDAAWERRVESMIDRESGLAAFFLSKSWSLRSRLPDRGVAMGSFVRAPAREHGDQRLDRTSF